MTPETVEVMNAVADGLMIIGGTSILATTKVGKYAQYIPLIKKIFNFLAMNFGEAKNKK